MTMMTRATVVTALLLNAVPAYSAVMCQTRSGTVKIRDVCKPRETQVDPIALGLQGPQGEPGMCMCPTTTTSTTTTTLPRFADNGDGTILDRTTGLMWEKKGDDGSVHDQHNTFTWSATGTAADGTAFTTFLARLNNRCQRDESVDCTVAGDADCAGVGGPCGFAGHRDWRLPEVNRDGGREELDSLVNLSEPAPKTYGPLKAPCAPGCVVTDPTCSCTALPYYWAGTTYGANPVFAWAVGFGGGDVANGIKTDGNAVRAVRGGS
jgi:hypothetical protein